MAPALKFSATTSNFGTRLRNSSLPLSLRRSRARLRLSRLLRRKVAPTERPSGATMLGCDPRPDSPVMGSTLTTSAPMRASNWVAYGSACICSAARMRTPSSGWVTPASCPDDRDEAHHLAGIAAEVVGEGEGATVGVDLAVVGGLTPQLQPAFEQHAQA